MGVSTKKLSNVEPLFSVAAMPAAKSARQQLDTLLKTNQSLTMNISPVMAEVMLEQNSGNRPLRARSVARYAASMKAGDWMLTGEPIVFAKNGTLNDGQHRLHAIVKSGMTVRTDVRFGIERPAFVVTNIGEKRTPANVLQIAGEANSALLAAVVRLAVHFEAGQYSLSGYVGPQQTQDFLDDHPELREAARRGHTYYQRLRKISPSVFAFTWWKCSSIDAAAADVFFDKLSTGIGIGRAADPVHVVRLRLDDGRDERALVNPAIQAEIIFAAWNAMRTGLRIPKERFKAEKLGLPPFPLPR